MDDEKIQKITNLLEKGGTMLAQHHECGAPMFRYKGKVLCPVCDVEETEREIKTIDERVVEVSGKTEIKQAKAVHGYEEIGDLIKNKLHSIASGLENESDLQRVKEKLECIETGIRVLKLLRE